MPTVTREIRIPFINNIEEVGLTPILEELKQWDPVHYEEVDRMNYKRVIHAVENMPDGPVNLIHLSEQTAKKNALSKSFK